MEESSIDLPVAKASKGAWVISVFQSEIVFRQTDGTYVRRIPRSAAPKELEIQGLASRGRPFIVARVPNSVIFNLTKDQAAVVKRWLSPLDEGYVREIINRFVVAWGIPLGVVYLLAIDWKAMTGIDVLRVVAGVCLIAIAIFGKVRPRQSILLLNVGVCAIVIVLIAFVAFQDLSWWRLLLAGFFTVVYGVLNINLYRLISSLREAPSPVGP